MISYEEDIFSIFFLFVMCVVAFLPTQEVSAKGKVKLSATKKTITVGQQYKLRLKNAGKVTWKTSRKSVVKIQKKGKNYVYVVGKKKGTATITATYKKKKYKCKITVKNKKTMDNPALNATHVTLYHIEDMNREFITCDSSHLNQYQLEVTGTKKEVISWELTGADASYFRINDGLVQMWVGIPYEKDTARATVQATLEDGTILTAEVTGYSEEHAYIDNLFENFKNTYITADMTEYQKMEKCAWYIQAMFDYEYYQSSWMNMAVSGGGIVWQAGFLWNIWRDMLD